MFRSILLFAYTTSLTYMVVSRFQTYWLKRRRSAEDPYPFRKTTPLCGHGHVVSRCWQGDEPSLQSSWGIPGQSIAVDPPLGFEQRPLQDLAQVQMLQLQLERERWADMHRQHVGNTSLTGYLLANQLGKKLWLG
jgi:hypothetical protein